MVLEANQYAVSDAFVATQEDIYQIIAIMRKVKVYIAEIVQKIEASKK